MMRIQVRNKVFETNSSSSHSVTIDPVEIRDFRIDKETLRDGVISIDMRSYGWEHFIYRTPQGKLGYLLAQFAEREVKAAPIGEDIAPILTETNEQAAMLIRVMERVTGCRVEVVNNDSYYIGVEGGVGWEVMGSEAELERFLFNSKSFIRTGNDNTGPGEFIMTDDGDPVAAYPDMYASVPDDAVTVKVEFSTGRTTYVKGEIDGEEFESDGFIYGILYKLGGMVVVKGGFEPTDPAERSAKTPLAGSQEVRDPFIREMSCYGVKMLKDANITGAFHEFRFDDWRTVFRAELAATPEQVFALKERIAEEQNRAPRA